MKLIFSNLGLLLSVIGALFMFKFGVPSVLDKSGVNLIGDYGDEKSHKKAKKYSLLANIGIIILCLGFILQLLSNNLQ